MNMEQNFKTDDQVRTKNVANGLKWLSETIGAKTGPMCFEIKLDYGRIIRRHVDHFNTCVFALVYSEIMIVPNSKL